MKYLPVHVVACFMVALVNKIHCWSILSSNIFLKSIRKHHYSSNSPRTIGMNLNKKSTVATKSTTITNKIASPTVKIPKEKKTTVAKKNINVPSVTIAKKDNEKTKTKEINSTDQTKLMNDILKKLMSELKLDMLTDEANNNNEKNDQQQLQLFNGVVRIYCTHSEPNFSMPWQRLKQDFSTSTGFIIGDNKILTNAHAVEYGSLIQVKKRQSEKKYIASVVAVGHECDLAILSVEDPTFWENVEPLVFGNIPDLLEDVSVVGYPVGGDSISISSGVVSRIEMQEYAQ
eukprot:gene14895-20031_t